MDIKKPIFVVGCFRSGTTVFCRKLAQHPDLATVTQTSKKIPSSMLLTRLLMLLRNDKKNFDPSDGSKIWNRFRGEDDFFVGREGATLAARKYLDKVIKNHLQLFGKPRFLSKSTANSLRMEFLDELYPDAFFIHVIRDGRAVANSIRHGRVKRGIKFNGAQVPGWREFVDLPMAEACGRHWKAILEYTRKSAEQIPEERYMEVKYEDFVAEPIKVLKAVGEKCELSWDDELLKEITSDLESRNYKWRDNFTEEEVGKLNSILGGVLKELGYEV